MRFEFATATRIIFGAGTLQEVGSIAVEMGKRALVVNGLPEGSQLPIAEVLTAHELDFLTLPVNGEPTVDEIRCGTQYARENHCDLIIGFGGGSALDTGKAIAAFLTNTGNITDYLEVIGLGRSLTQPSIPYIAVPTTAGTGSEVSPASVFVDSRDQAKKGVRSDFILPEVAILDPILTLELPRPLTASTGMDALTHAIETYTALRATMMSDILAERAIRLIADNLRRAYANGNDLPARDGMLMGSLLAGMALAVANVGGVHALAQTMGGMHRIPHGIANSVLLPYVMEFNRMACRERYAKIADLLAGPVQGLSLDEASRRAVQAVRDLIRDLHLPQHLRELDITEDSLRLIAERCMETQGRILSNNPRAISVGEAEGILREAL